MQAYERENKLYRDGKRCLIQDEELYMMNLLGQPHKNREKLLDIGCGTGEISLALRDRGFEPFGIDFSKTAIDIASKAGLSCKHADLDDCIPLDNKSFDVVWAGDVMEHVFDPIGVFNEIHRVMKDDGEFYATVPYNLDWKERIKLLFGRSFQDGVYRKYKQFKHHTFFTEDLMRYMYDTNSLRITEIAYLIQNPFTGKKSITSLSLFRIFAHTMIVRAVKL